MNWNVGARMAIGFGASVLIFLIVGTLSFTSVRQLVGTSELRGYTNDVLRRSAGVMSLLVDIQSAQRGYVLTNDESYLEPYRRAAPQLEQFMLDLFELAEGDDELRRNLDILDPLVADRLRIARSQIERRQTEGLDAVIQEMTSVQGQPNMEAIRDVLGRIQSTQASKLEARASATDRSAARTQVLVVAGTALALVLAALVGYFITRSIARPLRELTGIAERIAVGDLSVVPMTVGTRSDEVGTLANAFARMTGFLRTMAGTAEQIAAGDLRVTLLAPQSDRDVLGQAFVRMSSNLREQISSLVEGANVLSSSASEIVASTAQLASGARESATAVSQTTTTVEEVRQTAQLASQKARAVSESAQKVAQISQSGRRATTDVIDGMARIHTQMDAIAESMVRLSEQTQAIGQVIATVEDLASQSNLLAVNAAIEAAKAGEQGKGFAVVAQEVKALAEQSRQATNQVRTILGEIQKATSAAVTATEQGGKAVEAGSGRSEVAGEAIQALTDSVTEAAEAATQIAASSRQQLVGMEQVATAMDNIGQASNQSVASARQLEAAARNLDGLGQQLKTMVERYRI